jgi:virginiamycin B lyase
MSSINSFGNRVSRFAVGTILMAGIPGQCQATPAQTTNAVHVRPPRVSPTGIKAPGVVHPLSELKPTTIYPVEGSPDWSVITKDAVWVSSARVNHVVQLLPSTGKVGLTAEVAKPCSGLAYGWNSVWVPSCGAHKLLRLDQTTGKVTAEVQADPANSEGGITIGNESIWMVVKPSTLVRIDPNSNAVVSTLALPTGSENPAFGDGFIWVSSFGHDQLLKVDPKLNKIVATIPVGPKPRFLTVGGGSVWTLNQGDGTISRVDMKTDKLVTTIECGLQGEGGEITFGAGSIWAALFDFPLTQVDVKTNLPLKQWAGKGGDGVRFGFDSVWLSNLMQGTVWRISPEQQ